MFNLHSAITSRPSASTAKNTPVTSPLSLEADISRVVFPEEGRTSSISAHLKPNYDNSTICQDNHLILAAAVDQDTISNGNCSLAAGQVMHNDTCKRLLAQATCAEGEWLVLGENDLAECKPRPCPFGQLKYNAECVAPENTTVCSYGKILYVEMTGDTYCDCEPGFKYDPFSGNCYARYEQGPCLFGNYLDLTKESNCTTMECVPNKCEIDGFISGRNDNLCYRKMYSGFCESAYQLFHQVNQTVECGAMIWRSIFDVATLRTCPEGSVRDHRQECRQLFHVPSISSYPSMNGECSIGFIKDPNGICRRVHSILA